MYRNAFFVVAGIVTGAAVLLLGACAGKSDAPSAGPAGDAFGELRAKLVEVVDDPRREADAMRELDALFEDLRLLENAYVDRRNRLRRLNADYDTPREEFDSLLEEVKADMRKRHDSATEHHRKLVAVLTPDELEAIQKLKSDAVTGSLRELQSL